MIVEQDDGVLARESGLIRAIPSRGTDEADLAPLMPTAFDAGDICWILTCTALVWLMM
jgi:hypothetical protein